jgi:hypothetical protein
MKWGVFKYGSIYFALVFAAGFGVIVKSGVHAPDQAAA